MKLVKQGSLISYKKCMKELREYVRLLELQLTDLSMEESKRKEIFSLIENIKIEVDEEKKLIEAAKDSHLFYKAALDVLPNPVFVKNEDAQFVYFNPEYEKYFDIKAKDFLNKSVLDLTYLPLEERTRYQEEDLALIATGLEKHYETTFTLPDQSTGYSLYWSKGFETKDAKQKGLVGEIVDITVQKQLRDEIIKNVMQLEKANKQIESLMIHDSLTGLCNRRIIEDLFRGEAITSMSDYAHPTILLADLDYFKSVNDTYGHLVGDDMLVNFSRILEECCNEKDLLIRYGGEEFLIILLERTREQALAVANNIRESAQNKLLLPNKDPLTVSVGVTRVSENESFHQGMVRVDKALYAAKENGRNQIIER